MENRAVDMRRSVSPHSIRLNVQKVTRPTSNATGNDSDAAWNFTGVARKATPASIPAQNAATKAVAATGKTCLWSSLIRLVPP